MNKTFRSQVLGAKCDSKVQNVIQKCSKNEREHKSSVYLKVGLVGQ